MCEDKSLGISVIISTCKRVYIDRIIENYKRQKFEKKELIIIINSNSIPENIFEQYQKDDSSIHAYTMDEEISLGACLNFATNKAYYDYVCRIDDDDYYGENFLKEIYDALKSDKGDVVGKSLTMVYYYDEKVLSVRKGNYYNKLVPSVVGGSISYSKEFFKKLQYRELNIGEDAYYVRTVNQLEYRLYATSKYGYICIRHKDLNLHTFKVESTRYKDKNYWEVFRNVTYEEAVAAANSNQMLQSLRERNKDLH